MPESFHIKLTGNILPGFTPEQAVSGLAAVMRIDDRQAGDLLAARETIVKRGVPADQVQRYLQAIERAGVEALAESAVMLSDPAELPLPTVPRPEAEPASAAASPGGASDSSPARLAVPFPRAIPGWAATGKVEPVDVAQQRTVGPWSPSAAPLPASDKVSLSGPTPGLPEQMAARPAVDQPVTASAAPWPARAAEALAPAPPSMPQAAAAGLALVEDSAQPAATMECPACGALQPQRTLCQKCGADMPRLLASRLEARYQPADNSAYAPPRARVRDPLVAGETPRALSLSFQGRIGRLRYLAYALPAYLPLAIGFIAGGALAGFLQSSGVLSLAVTIGALLTAVLSLRLTVLRLHDLNRSGWWCLLWIVAGGAASAARSQTMLLVGIALFALGSLALAFWPGSRQSNSYGAPPGENTIWTILGAVLMIGLSLAGMATSQTGKLGVGGLERGLGGERSSR